MTKPQLVKEYYTKEEYLAFEEVSRDKHEYEGGKIKQMPDVSLQHAFIGGNMLFALKTILKKRKKSDKALSSSVKIYVEDADLYTYPDGLVVCESIECYLGNDAITNPTLILEILSEDTANYDRGAKFRKYCTIPTFKEYVLITQDEPVVEVLFRDIDFWRMTTTVGLDRSVKLNSLDIEIPMELIYEDIENLPNPQFGLDF